VTLSIHRIDLPLKGMGALEAEAREQGYDFICTLVEEWGSGKNRFDGPGEALYGCFENEGLIAVGALSCDPYAGEPGVGRIRRLFVRTAFRNQGVGRALVSALVERARIHFRCVRLRAVNADAARLYERLGFVAIESPHCTHVMVLQES
jgi:GNAT superfamily N-acetyltransferase